MAQRESKKYGAKAGQKVEKAMHEMKRGKLKSGRSGKKVKSRKQAIAIGLSEARRAAARSRERSPGSRPPRGGRSNPSPDGHVHSAVSAARSAPGARTGGVSQPSPGFARPVAPSQSGSGAAALAGPGSGSGARALSEPEPAPGHLLRERAGRTVDDLPHAVLEARRRVPTSRPCFDRRAKSGAAPVKRVTICAWESPEEIAEEKASPLRDLQFAEGRSLVGEALHAHAAGRRVGRDPRARPAVQVQAAGPEVWPTSWRIANGWAQSARASPSSTHTSLRSALCCPSG